MSEHISAMMDGELPDRDCIDQIALLGRDPEHRRTWEVYNLIGDALRGDLHAGCASRVSLLVADEPAVLAPRKRLRDEVGQAIGGQQWFVLSAAAVIAAIAFVAWIALPVMTSPLTPQVAQINSGPAGTLVTSADFSDSIPIAVSSVGDYLMAHQQFSPSNSIQGVAPYVRLVSEEAEGSGR